MAATKSLLLCLLLIAAMGGVPALPESPSIAGVLYSLGYVGFSNLFERAGLVRELEEQGEKYPVVTIFALNDKFLHSKLSPVLLSWLNMERNVLTLRQVLMSHVIIGTLTTEKNSVYTKSVSGTSLEINNFNGKLSIGGVTIDQTRVFLGRNFIIYPVDGLIISDEIKARLAAFLTNVQGQADRGIRLFDRHASMKLEVIAPVSSGTPPASSPSSEVPEPPSVSPVASPPTSSSPSSSPSGSPFPSASPSLAPSAVPSLSPSGESPSPSESPASTESPLDQVIRVLTENGNYQSLLKYFLQINRTELETIFDQGATFLAPTDYAFGTLEPATVDSLVYTNRILDVVMYHILPEYVPASGFKTGSKSSFADITSSEKLYEYDTELQEYKLNVTVNSDGLVFLGPKNSTIVDPDLLLTAKTSVSGIDQVLIPDDSFIQASTSPPDSPSASQKSGALDLRPNMLPGMIFMASLLLFIL